MKKIVPASLIVASCCLALALCFLFLEYRPQAGIVSRTENIVIKAPFDYAGDFSCGLGLVRIGRPEYLNEEVKWYYVDKTGRIAIEPKFDYVREFSEGMVAFEKRVNGPMKNGIWGYIDKSGNIVIEPKYSQVRNFSEGLSAVITGSSRNGDCYNYIDKTGEVAIETKYNVVGDFSEGLARVAVGVLWTQGKPLETTWGYIDKEGNTVIEPQFDYAEDFSEGIACVDVHPTKCKYNYIDKAGKFIFDSVN